MKSNILLFVTMVCSVLMMGCSSSEPAPVPVKGMVKTKKGQPCDNALVVLHPTAKDRLNDAKPVATTNAEGKFVLTTFALDDGALPGDYSVTVVWPGKGGAESKFSLSGEGEGAAGGADQLKGKYGNPSQPLLKATVPAQGGADLLLEVEP